MATLRYKAATTVIGLLIGWLAYQFSWPWWVYLLSLVTFLTGLVSFSMEGKPDGSGYGKRADDSRGQGYSHGDTGGGDC